MASRFFLYGAALCCGLGICVWVVNLHKFRKTTFALIFVVLFLLALFVDVKTSKSTTASLLKSPDIHITGIQIQPEMGDGPKFIFYLSNNGNTPGTLEIAIRVSFVGHISENSDNRKQEETMFFSAAAYDLDDPVKQKVYVDVDSHDTFGAIIDTKLSFADFDKQMADKEVVLVTAKAKQVGHPEIPPLEACVYWQKGQYLQRFKCEVHNTD